MLKKIILLFLLCLSILLTALSYLNDFLLPVKIKDVIVDTLSAALDREVTMDRLHYVPFKGIVAHNITIKEKPPLKGTFVHVEEASINIFSLALLSEQRIMIPSIMIHKPRISLLRAPTGSWNFDDLLAISKEQDTTRLPNIYIAKASLFEGKIIFFDQTLGEQPATILDNVAVEASISIPTQAKFMVRILPTLKNPTKFILDVQYDFTSKDFLCQLHAENFPVQKALAYIKNTNVLVDQTSLPLATLEISRRHKKINANGRLLFGSTTVKTSSGHIIQGHPSLILNNIDIQDQLLLAQGTLDLSQGSCSYQGQEIFHAHINYPFTIKHKDTTIESNGPIAIKDLSLTLKDASLVAESAQGQISLAWNAQKSKISAQIKYNHATLNFSASQKLLFNPELTIECAYDLEAKKNPWSYEGALLFSSAKLHLPPLINSVDDLQGKINFNAQGINTQNLSGLFKYMPFELSGSLKDLANPSLSIQGKFKYADLENFNEILALVLPEQKIQMKGKSDITVLYQGGIKTLNRSSVNLSLSLNDAAIKTAFLPQGIFHISGNIDYQTGQFSEEHFLPGLANWKNLKLQFEERSYTLNGKLAFNNLSTTLATDDFNIVTDIRILRDRLRILSLEAKYLNSVVNVEGDVFHQSPQAGRINLIVDGQVQLEHLTKIFPQAKASLEPLALNGPCAIKGRLSGDPGQWIDATILGTLKSPGISIKGFHLNNVALDFRQRDMMINKCILAAKAYQGTLSLTATANLKNKNLPYELTLDSQRIDLRSLKKDLQIGNKPLSGLASLFYEGRGSLKDINQTAGEGSLTIEQGELFPTEILKGLGQLLFVSQHQNITLEHIQANFLVKNQKILIDQGILKSNQMEISCEGSIDFSGNLDLGLISRFDEGTFRSSQSLQKTILAGLSQGEPLVKVKVTGTIKEPKHTIVAQPLRILEKTQDLIFDGLLDMF